MRFLSQEMGVVVALGTKWSSWKEEWILEKLMC